MKQISVKHVGEREWVSSGFSFHTGKSLKETVGLLALNVLRQAHSIKSHIYAGSCECSYKNP